MLATLAQLLSLLNRSERLRVLELLASALLAALFELVGVTSIMPFMGLAANPQLLEQQPRLHAIYQKLGFSSPGSFLVFWGAMVLIGLTTVNLLTALNIWQGCRFGFHQQRRLSRRLYLAYLRRPYGWHLERHSTELLDDLKRAREMTDRIYRPLTVMVARGATGLALVAVILWINPVVALLTTLLLGVLFTLVYSQFRRNLRHLSDLELGAAQETERALADSLGTLKQIKLSHRYEHFCRRYDRQVGVLSDFLNQRTMLMEMPRLALHTLTSATVVALVLYLQATLQNPNDLIPLVSLYALASFRILPALHQFLGSAFLLSSSHAIVDKLSRELSGLAGDEEVELPPPRPMQSELRLVDASFTYPRGAEPAVSHCSLTLRRGMRLGLVGSTGSGKTTLLNLLVGLLEPEQGRLELDGASPGATELAGLQRTIGYVPQDVYLADDTVAANIALGEEEVDRERVERAARRACLHDFLATLPRGYQTLIGERGIRLSGGQRQRLGLARALYQDPQLLILDEATSALDSGTEAEVLQALAGLEGERTLMMVAHRLTTVQHCDLILVMSHGRLAATGTYAELLEGSAEFQALAPA